MSSTLQGWLHDDVHLREVYAKAGIDLVFRFVGILVRYLFVWLIIRWFGAPMFGKWSLTLVLLSILGVVASLGIKLAIVRFVAEARARDETGRLRDAFLKSLVLLSITGVLGGLGLYAFSDLLSLVFNKPGLEDLIRIAAFGLLPFNLVMLSSGSLRGLRYTAVHSFVETTGTPLFAIGLLVVGYFAFGFGYMFALAYVGSLWILAGVSLVLWLWLSGLTKSRQRTGSITFRELLSISLPMYVGDSTGIVIRWADIIMIGLFCNDLDLAAYSLVLRLASLIIIPLTAVNTIAAPKLAEFHSLEDVAGMARMARQSTRMIFWLALPLFLFLLVFSNWVLGFFDSDLTFGAPALIIVGIGQFANAASGPVGPILNMTGHQHVMRNIILLASVLNLILNYLLIQAFGIQGAAMATSFTLVLGAAMSLYYIKKKFDFVPISVPFLAPRHQ